MPRGTGSVPWVAHVHVCLSVCACGHACVPLSSPVTCDCCVSWTEGEATRSAFSACPLSLLPPFPTTLAQDLISVGPPVHVSTKPPRACIRPGAESGHPPALWEQASPLPRPEALAWARARLCLCYTRPWARGSCGGLDPTLRSQASEHFGGPPSLWQGKREKGGGRQALFGASPACLPPALSAYTVQAGKGPEGGRQWGLILLAIPPPQPGSGSVNPKLRSHLLPRATPSHAASISPGGSGLWRGGCVPKFGFRPPLSLTHKLH